MKRALLALLLCASASQAQEDPTPFWMPAPPAATKKKAPPAAPKKKKRAPPAKATPPVAKKKKPAPSLELEEPVVTRRPKPKAARPDPMSLGPPPMTTQAPPAVKSPPSHSGEPAPLPPPARRPAPPSVAPSDEAEVAPLPTPSRHPAPLGEADLAAPSRRPAAPALPPPAPVLPPEPSPTPIASDDDEPVVLHERARWNVGLAAGGWAKTRSDGSGRFWDPAYGVRGSVALLAGAFEVDVMALRSSGSAGSPFISASAAHNLFALRAFGVLGDRFALLAGGGGGLTLTQTHYTVVDVNSTTPQGLDATSGRATFFVSGAGRARFFGGLEARAEVSAVLRDGHLELLPLFGLGAAF